MTAEQAGLFDEPEKPPVRPVTLADAERLARITFTNYTAKTPPPCDHCKQAQAVNSLAPIARKAKVRVRHGVGSNLVELLCEGHADVARQAVAKARKAAEVAAHVRGGR